MEIGASTVLHVIPALRTGGAEHMLAALVTAKRKHPFPQAVVAFMANGALAAKIRSGGVPVYDLRATGPADLPATLLRLSRLIRQLRPATIQSWMYYGDLLSLWALRLSRRRAATRLYWGIRCSDMDQRRYGRALRWTIAACARNSAAPDAIIANSLAGMAAHRRLGYTPRASAIVPNGVDLVRFQPDPPARKKIRALLGISEDKPMVLQLARLDPMKDYESLCRLATSLPEIHFVIAGSGTENLDVPANVTPLGVRDDVPGLLAAADVLVLTSAFGEGFPNVVAEAMATGIPVVATDVGDTKRIVGSTGFIVPPHDVAGMATGVRALLAEPETNRRRRASGCRQRIEQNFSLDRAVEVFDALHLHGTLPAQFPADDVIADN